MSQFCHLMAKLRMDRYGPDGKPFRTHSIPPHIQYPHSAFPMNEHCNDWVSSSIISHSCTHVQILGPVALKLGDELLTKIRTDTTIMDLLEQLDKACRGGQIQDADGFDVTFHYSQDLPEGAYIRHQTATSRCAYCCCSLCSCQLFAC